jgi:membrane protease YdiL (CAAX protease family)
LIMSFVRRYSVAFFYTLALAIGTGILYLVVSGTLPPRLALASVLSASISGIVITAVEDGRAGLKLLFGRLLKWRAGLGYWIFAFLFIIPVFLAGSTFNPLFGGDPIDFSRIEPAFPILPMFISFFIVAGLGQELGWTGFLIPKLQGRHSALVSSIVRAILVTIWHLPLLLYSRHPQPALTDFPYSGWIAQRGFLVTLAVMTLFALPWSIFYTWMFNNTKGSLLLVSLLHASEIWVAYLMMSAGIDPNNIDNYWGYGAVMMLVATAIVLMTGYQHLSQNRKRIAH